MFSPCLTFLTAAVPSELALNSNTCSGHICFWLTLSVLRLFDKTGGMQMIPFPPHHFFSSCVHVAVLSLENSRSNGMAALNLYIKINNSNWLVWCFLWGICWKQIHVQMCLSPRYASDKTKQQLNRWSGIYKVSLVIYGHVTICTNALCNVSVGSTPHKSYGIMLL